MARVFLKGYNNFGGRHSTSGAICNALSSMNLQGEDGIPITQELVFGIGGGLDASYFIYKGSDRTNTLMLGTTNYSTSTDNKFTQLVAQRLGIEVDIHETAAEKQAEKHVLDSLKRNIPVIVAGDLASMPYYHLPESQKQYCMHTFGICGYNASTKHFFLDDRCKFPIPVTMQAIRESRNAILSQRNRSIAFLRPPHLLPLAKSIQSGILDCARNLLDPDLESLGLKGLEKWVKYVANHKNKKGWAHLFNKDNTRFSVLIDLYTSIQSRGSCGAAFRYLYTDFLKQSAEILKNDALLVVAEQFKGSGNLWAKLADTALPDSVPVLAEIKQKLIERDRQFSESGLEAFLTVAEVNHEIDELGLRMKDEFPLTTADFENLLNDMEKILQAILEAETVAAIDLLKVMAGI